MALTTVVFFTLVLYGIKAVHADTSMSSFTARVRRVEGEIRAWKVMAVDAGTKLINNFTELEKSLKQEVNETFIPSLIKRLVKQTITDLLTGDYTRNITSRHDFGEVHTLKAREENATKQLEAITEELRRVQRERDTYKESLGKLRGELTKDLLDVQLQLNQTVDDARSYARMRCCGEIEIKEDESSLSGTISSVANPGRTSVTPSEADGNIYSAIQKGDLERVKQILAAGHVDINMRSTRFSRTPVMVAALRGQSDVVKLLMDRGANMSLVDKFGNNVLHHACTGGDLETVKLILSQNMMYINSRGNESRTPLMEAAFWGESDVVKLLVDRGANMSLVDKFGNNVIHHACIGGDLETVKLILSQNVMYINSRGNESRTPLMEAAWRGQSNVVKLLVDRGANLSLVDEYSYNVLHFACMGGDLETVQLILSQNVTDINIRGNGSRTPLMEAAFWGESDVVKLLMDRGANMSLVDKFGNNVLHHACIGGDLETVKLILSQNVMYINSRGNESRTPLMEAAWSEHRDVVKLLVDRGANLSLVDEYSYNVLHFACMGGDLETVQLILSQNVTDINIRGNGSRTPLMEAAWRGHRDVVEFLVGRGANMSLVDKMGDNVLHFASTGGDLKTVELILSLNKVDINATNSNGQTAIDLARDKGHQRVVDFLVSHDAH
ncbi:ankyrin repeat, PH and SEC7 domain containing protein secG-like [Haliotis asinina]|uniref:ankyrin repeat, PH and SEC7 domain containing protein secG-like n=1 Tax=Haliotis asinina TaxID=109174 RepID=UPI0035322A02